MKLLLALLPLTLSAAELPEIPAVNQAVQAAIDAREVAGAVTLVSDGDQLRHLAAAGMADLAAGKPMSVDALFWIASMTKPVTGVAVMMMQEEGRLSIDDPVSKFLPEFKDLKDGDGKPVTVTLKHCLTHSGGLAELSPEEAARITTLAELTAITAGKPVSLAPGSKWQYSQTGINTAARVVEVVSGQLFPEFLEQRLFAPLGMKDTTFYPNDEQVKRLATSYARTDSGTLEPAPLSFLHGKSPTSRDRYPLANGGLFSTARDYWAFCRMLLNDGELDGRRYLKPESVKQMTSVQSGELTTGFTPGNGWGLGCCIIRQPQGVSAMLSAGSYGHGGAYGTQAWIDPVKKRIYLLMVQRANFPNSDNSPLRLAFQKAAAF